MHPAYSVIVFTTASGAGYGLLFWLSLAHVAGWLPEGRWTPFIALALALVLITLGLLSSTLHLGRPERAWRAVSQWRSSWLSREGVAALATYVPAGLLALAWLFGVDAAPTGVLATLSAIGAVATVWCTGMIYASLRTIRQWHQPLVPVVYLALAAASGALLLALILSLAGAETARAVATAGWSLTAAMVLKLAYYAAIDRNPGQNTAGLALGMTAEARVRPLDPPHTQPNYVMREMGYAVARRHATRLRRIALACLFALPLALVLLVLAGGAPAVPPLLLAAVSATAGLVTERWLFFAEAEHVAMLFYGRARA